MNHSQTTNIAQACGAQVASEAWVQSQCQQIKLAERHQGVANDRSDALALATPLDRYVAGNDRALAMVRVPTEAEEQKRAHKRQRQ